MEQPLSYTVPEAAKLCGIGLTKIYAEIGTGRLEAIKLGRRTLIRRSAIEAWLDALPAYEVRVQ